MCTQLHVLQVLLIACTLRTSKLTSAGIEDHNPGAGAIKVRFNPRALSGKSDTRLSTYAR